MSKEYNRQEQIREVHQQRRQRTEKKVSDAIDHLLKTKQPVNFNKVAEVSGVSVATLYKNQNIRERIEFLRGQINKLPSSKDLKKSTSDDGKDAIIASLKRKIKKLEQEKEQLQKALDEYQAGKWTDL